MGSAVSEISYRACELSVDGICSRNFVSIVQRKLVGDAEYGKYKEAEDLVNKTASSLMEQFLELSCNPYVEYLQALSSLSRRVSAGLTAATATAEGITHAANRYSAILESVFKDSIKAGFTGKRAYAAIPALNFSYR
jgi:hypothetical protein